MNDRELLELAAKAAGVDLHPIHIKNVTEQGDDRFIGYMTNKPGNGWFAPLTDDGDAFRLAVKLNLIVGSSDIRFGTHQVFAKTIDTIGEFVLAGSDPYAATRRAIVRAAAEIGRGMK